MDEQPFLDAIHSNPDDETQRLIYADWLEERGDPLGELIRVAVDMAQCSIFDPRYWDLKERRNELRALTDARRQAILGYDGRAVPMFQTIPAARIDRWKLLDRFIDAWHAEPLTRDSGATAEEILAAVERLGVRLPSAVQEFYYLMGNRLDLGGHQDRFVPTDELQGIMWGPLLFRIENQTVCRWSTAMGESHDPPVWCDEGRDPATHRYLSPPHRQCEQFSEFILLTIFYETIAGSAIGGWTADPTHVAEIERTFQRAGFSGSYWFMQPVRFYEGPGVLLNVSETDDYLYVAFRHAAAIDQLSSDLREALHFHPY